MRKIKFRGYDGGSWMYGATVNHEIGNGCDNWRMIQSEEEFDEWLHVINIGQYTGLKDKKGIELYEKDIVSFYDGLTDIKGIGVVNFKDASFYIKADSINHFRWIDYEVEVIGNVYENPKLLKEQYNQTNRERVNE